MSFPPQSTTNLGCRRSIILLIQTSLKDIKSQRDKKKKKWKIQRITEQIREHRNPELFAGAVSSFIKWLFVTGLEDLRPIKEGDTGSTYSFIDRKTS